MGVTTHKNMETAFQALLRYNEVCQFMSVEKKAEKASNSEIRRWFANKAIEVNFESIAANDPWPPVIKSLVMFPKSKVRRCTLVWEQDTTLIQINE